MSIAAEFPDYDPATLPAIPDDWIDTSWHNNACPSFEAPNRYSVWIDYADPAQREYSGGKRYTVHALGADGAFKSYLPDLATDDWDAVLALVSKGPIIPA